MSQTSALLRALGVPGLISCASLLFAWLAIVTAINLDMRASINFAVAAFVLDSLDGLIARWIGKVSEFGRQLDSMVDLVNYSVYAAVVIYLTVLPGLLGCIVGFLVLLFGLLRLIRFNLDGYMERGHTSYYRGVVTCHLSLATILFVLIGSQVEVSVIIPAITLSILAFLQLSDIRTRKSGLLWLWYVICAVILVGANTWLA